MTGPAPLDLIVPQNTDAERSLLGAMLRDNDLFELVSDKLIPAHFYEPAHGEIWRWIVGELENGRSANAITLRHRVDTDPAFAAMRSILKDLCDGSILTTKRMVKDCASIIEAMAVRRGLAEVGDDLKMVATTADWEMSPSDMIADAEAKLFRMTPESEDEGPVSLDTALDEAMDAIDRAMQPDDVKRRVVTGLVDVDRKIGRLDGGDLVVMAGRASMGKTALAMDVAENNVVDGRHVAFFSMEMPRKQLAQRRMARRSKVSVTKQRTGELTNDEYNALLAANAALRGLPMHIDDRAKLTLSQVRATSRRLHRKFGLSLIIIDYVQIMGDEPHMGNAPRTYQIGYITSGLKALAKELDIPIVILAQVNRGVEKAEDKRPQMSDLKDSGSIEQDADVVMFVYREAYYLERNPPVKKEHESEDEFRDRSWKHEERLEAMRYVGEVIIAKARNGEAPAIVPVSFDPEGVSFGNLAKGYAD